MDVSTDLEVDVNGQQNFWVNQKILGCYCGLFANRGENAKNKMKVIFEDFPGGPAGFELITRFCYKNGAIEITHSNVVLLNQAAKFMEMHKNVLGRPNLISATERFLEGMDCWTWSELLETLKHGQGLLIGGVTPISFIQTMVDEVIERLASPSLATPSSISSKTSSFRSSCDSKSTSTLSTKTSNFQRFWWFEELSELDVDAIDMIVRKMVKEKFDHAIISKFLFYYQRERVLDASKVTRARIIQRVIALLSLLDKRSISIKRLFDTLRIASSLKLKKSSKIQLELLIGSQLDQADLDDLLLPSPNHGKRSKSSTKYNVNLVLRFLKNFLLEGNISYKLCSYRLKKVARLVDLYASEIAPDARVKPSKFAALAMVIPDSARDTYDRIYQAIEIYLEVHPRLVEEKKMKICSVLNYEKLSPQVLNRLSRNTSFPLVSIVKALIHQNPKLKRAKSIKDACNFKGFNSFGSEAKEFKQREEVVIIKKLSTNEKLRAHLQRIGWTDIELEKMFSKLQTQNEANVRRTPQVCCISNHVKHLPKLCS